MGTVASDSERTAEAAGDGGPPAGGPRGAPSARSIASALGLVALAASLVVGTNLFGAREALFGSAAAEPRASAFSRIVTDSPAAERARSDLRSQPWWQQVRRYSGAAGSVTVAPPIDDGAIQWRMTIDCERGRLTVAAGGPRPLAAVSCPARGRRVELVAKPGAPLRIVAAGPWRMRVEQQVDVPLFEPPLPAMRAPGARRVATGSFYRVDQSGRGRVDVYRLPSGRHALRLEDFYVTPNIDLEIRLSPLRRPKTTRQYLSRPAAFVKMLDVTTGEMNFVVPKGIDPTRYRSLVLWCQNLTSAYAAASLRAVGA